MSLKDRLRAAEEGVMSNTLDDAHRALAAARPEWPVPDEIQVQASGVVVMLKEGRFVGMMSRDVYDTLVRQAGEQP